MMLTHKQKPCGLVGDTLCGEFKEGDLTTCSDTVKITCPKCKKKKK